MAMYTSVHASDFPVKSVILYHPSTCSAKVTRTFTFKALNFSQQHIFEIVGLSSVIDTDSIAFRISDTQGNVHINSVQCTLDTHLLSEAPLAMLRAQRLSLENEGHVAEEAASFLSTYMKNLSSGLSKSAPTFPAPDTLVSSLTDFMRIRVDLATTITAINERIATLDAQIDAETVRMRNHGTAMARVVLVLTPEGNSVFSDCELEMTYLVRDVCWEPTYELRATKDNLGMQSESPSTSLTVDFRIIPCVRQSTGEFWDDVELSFSLVEQEVPILYLPRQQRMKIRERTFTHGDWEDWPPASISSPVYSGHPDTPVQFAFNGRPTNGFSNSQHQVKAGSNTGSLQSKFQPSNGPRATEFGVSGNERITPSSAFPKKKRRAKGKGIASEVKVEDDSTLLVENDNLVFEGIASKATDVMIDPDKFPGSMASSDTLMESLEQAFSDMKVLQSADHSRNVLEPPAVALQPAIEPKFIGTRSTLSDDLFEDVHASVYEDSEVGYNSIASVSVPTNGIPHLVFCTSTSLPAHTSRVAIPSVDKRVFYVCSVRCIGSSLLEGSVRFFVDDVHVAGATLTRNALGYRIDCPLAVDNNVSVGYSCKAEMGCVQFPQTLTNTTFRRTVFSAITICNNYPRPLYGLIIRHALPVSDDLHVQVLLRSPKDVANTEGSAMVNSDVQPDVHARWSSSHEHHSDSGLDWQQNKLLEWVCNLRPLEEKKLEAIWDVCTPKNIKLQYQVQK